MTTVIGFQGPDFAILGADSQITDGDKRIISPSTPKIVTINKYLFAVSGDVRPGDILAYNWKPPAYDGTNAVKFMGKKIIPSIVAAFRANAYDFEKDGSSFTFLLAFAGNIFQIGDSLDINQSADGLFGIGSGSPFALGYLAGATPNLAKPEWAEDEVMRALAISAKYDVNTCAPFQIEVQRV